VWRHKLANSDKIQAELAVFPHIFIMRAFGSRRKSDYQAGPFGGQYWPPIRRFFQGHTAWPPKGRTSWTELVYYLGHERDVKPRFMYCGWTLLNYYVVIRFGPVIEKCSCSRSVPCRQYIVVGIGLPMSANQHAIKPHINTPGGDTVPRIINGPKGCRNGRCR
jgi:hypothetical protein